MFDAIKSLSPKQRLLGFLFAVLISSVTAVLASYLETDDCSLLSDQYGKLIKNHSDLMAINNELIEENNKKNEAFIEIKKYVDSLYTAGLTQEVVKTIEKRPTSLRPLQMVRRDTSGRSPASVSPIEVEEVHVIEKTHIIKETPKNYNHLLEKLVNAVNDYKKIKKS